MVEARTIACTSCGASLTLRGLENTVTVACGQCGAVLDAKDPNLRILARYRTQAAIPPRIPLGTRGTFSGTPFELIGFLRRRIRVDGQSYSWSEYLLFNSFKGFRWLTEYEGHWALLGPAQPVPTMVAPSTGGPYAGREYRHFQSAQAEVTYVLGEFTWQVQVGEMATVRDYICPPYVLSAEQTGKERVWSQGQYLEPEEVWQAFKAGGDPPPRKGIGSCQPNPVGRPGAWWGAFGILLAAALLVQIVSGSRCADRQALDVSYRVQSSDPEKGKVTEPFVLEGRTSNLQIKTDTDLDNNWTYFHLALISLDGGAIREFGREVSWYHGVDDGESWSEGAASDTVVVGAVPPGRYCLRVEPELQTSAMNFHIQLRRDVPCWSPFWWALLLIGVPLVFQTLRWMFFESRRWSESDHPWVDSGDDDD